jgi:hydrogenase nickel incorporation protein HypA/HybF
VHELSIAQSIVEMVSEATTERVHEVHLRVGVLAGVSKDSLFFCYGIATEGTSLAGSTLTVNEIPVTIFCSVCQEEKEIADIQRFRCSVCDTPSGDVRHGRELEIESVIVDEYASS